MTDLLSGEFYTISTVEGYFCGFHRRWYNGFRRHPEFREDTMPHHGEAMTFPTRADAVNYAVANLRGHHIRVGQNIF